MFVAWLSSGLIHISTDPPSSAFGSANSTENICDTISWVSGVDGFANDTSINAPDGEFIGTLIDKVSSQFN